MFKSFIAAATIGTALIAAPAIAGSNTAGSHAAQSSKIQYADLNLATPEGQEQLERRIDTAARKVCKLGEHRTGTRIPSGQRKVCYAKARNSARSQMASLISDTRRGG
ncbi:MAG: UrcA family protein [Marinomonas sp.]